MTTKELKANNFLTQCKLDDALAEIQELTNLVEIMEKEKYNGIEIVNEPFEWGDCPFRIDQININYIHSRSMLVAKQKDKDFVYNAPDLLGDTELISIAHDLVARIESMEDSVEAMVEDAVCLTTGLYLDRFTFPLFNNGEPFVMRRS